MNVENCWLIALSETKYYVSMDFVFFYYIY